MPSKNSVLQRGETGILWCESMKLIDAIRLQKHRRVPSSTVVRIGRTQKTYFCSRCGREMRNQGSICTMCRTAKNPLAHDRMTSPIPHDVHGEKFIRAFDIAFGLAPITEFPYLLKYLELLSVKAAMSDANSSRSVGAQPFLNPIQDTTHPPRIAVRQKQSIVAAVGTKSFLRSNPHSPLTAAYFLSISARAQDKPTSAFYPISIQSKRGDKFSNGSQRFLAYFPLAFPPNYHNPNLLSSSMTEVLPESLPASSTSNEE